MTPLHHVILLTDYKVLWNLFVVSEFIFTRFTDPIKKPVLLDKILRVSRVRTYYYRYTYRFRNDISFEFRLFERHTWQIHYFVLRTRTDIAKRKKVSRNII